MPIPMTREENILRQTHRWELPHRMQAARYLLDTLFESTPYGEDISILVCCVCPRGVEDFFYSEIFNAREVIRLKMKRKEEKGSEEPQGEESAEEEEKRARTAKVMDWAGQGLDFGMLGQFVALYFLNVRQNSKLERAMEKLCDGTQMDLFLGECLLWEAGANNPGVFDQMIRSYGRLFHQVKEEERKSHFIQSVYQVFSETEFTWTGKESKSWSVTKRPSYVLTFEVSDFKDSQFEGEREGTRFPDYVSYLMKKERNGIVEVKSMKSFWAQTVGKSRANTILYMWPSDQDLARFCLMLGLDDKVFDRLCRLRNRYEGFTTRPVSKNPTPKTIKKQEMLRLFLKQVSHRVQEARFLCRDDPDRVPRQMLVSASIQLLLAGVSGICKVSVQEFKDYGLGKEQIQKLMGTSKKGEDQGEA